MSYKTHAIVKVSPRGRNTGTSRSETNFNYQLTQPVHFRQRQNPSKQYFVRLENVKIPVSYYNINSNYDTFGWTCSVTTPDPSFNITNGNYTIDELIAEVETQMNALDANTYSITYDEITQKVTITDSATGENITALTGDGWQTLGFDLTETLTAGGSMTGNNVAYTNTMGWMKLVVNNLNTSNYYENDTNANTQLQRVQLDIATNETRNGIIFYDNHDGPMYKLPAINSVIELNVSLLDKYNNSIDLNGVPWSFDVVFYEMNKFAMGQGGVI